MSTVVFDKTGTITEGRPRVIKMFCALPNSKLSLKRMCAVLGSAESSSEHPLGNAIVSFAKEVGFCLYFFVNLISESNFTLAVSTILLKESSAASF